MATTRLAKTTVRIPAKVAPKVIEAVVAPKLDARKAVRATGTALRAVATVVDTKSQDVVKDTKRAEKVYADTATRTSDRLQALMMSYSHLAEGYHDLERDAVTLLQDATETLWTAPLDLARSTSFTEFAEKQQNLVHKGVGDWLAASEIALKAARRIIDRALRPIEQQMSVR